MANGWFRMYAEFANDPKVQMMSEADQRRFVMLLCMRCGNDGVTLHDEEVAFQLRISTEEWAATKTLFLSKGLIGDDNLPTAWDRRQFVSDSSAARVRKHREKRKQEAKRARNVTATPPDTDTDTDKEKRSAATPPPHACAPAPAHEAPPPAAPPADPEIPADPPGPPAAIPDEAPKRTTQIAVLLRRNGADPRTAPNDRHIADWAREDVTDAEVLQALETAKARRRAQGSDQPIGTAYLSPIIADIRAAPPDAPASSGNRRDRYARDAEQIQAMARWADEQLRQGNPEAQFPRIEE